MHLTSSTLVKFSALALALTFSSANASSVGTKVVFDTGASVLKWTAKKVTATHHGRIKLKSGELIMKGTDLQGGEFTIDMTSIVDQDLTDPVYNKKLVTHLSSEDFFNVAKYPTAVLKIKHAKSVHGFTGPTYEVTADLTIKDKTNEVKFPAMIKTKDGKTTATANITIDRTRWAIKYGSGKFFPGLGDKLIYDDFKLDVTLVSK
jgi:polyisoprenoid-binding protein YceI